MSYSTFPAINIVDGGTTCALDGSGVIRDQYDNLAIRADVNGTTVWRANPQASIYLNNNPNLYLQPGNDLCRECYFLGHKITMMNSYYGCFKLADEVNNCCFLARSGAQCCTCGWFLNLHSCFDSSGAAMETKVPVEGCTSCCFYASCYGNALGYIASMYPLSDNRVEGDMASYWAYKNDLEVWYEGVLMACFENPWDTRAIAASVLINIYDSTSNVSVLYPQRSYGVNYGTPTWVNPSVSSCIFHMCKNSMNNIDIKCFIPYFTICSTEYFSADIDGSHRYIWKSEKYEWQNMTRRQCGLTCYNMIQPNNQNQSLATQVLVGTY